MQHDRKTAPAALERAEEAAVAQAGNVSLYINATSKLFPPRELQRGVSVQSVLASCTNIFTVLHREATLCPGEPDDALFLALSHFNCRGPGHFRRNLGIHHAGVQSLLRRENTTPSPFSPSKLKVRT